MSASQSAGVVVVVVDVDVVVVDEVPHADCSCAWSAASCCSAAASLAWSWVRVFSSWVIVLCDAPPEAPCVDGVVVVVVDVDPDLAGDADVDEDEEDVDDSVALVSSCASLASSESSVSCVGGNRLAQRRGVERGQRLPGGDLLAGRHRDRGDLAGDLERRRRIVDRLDGADHVHGLPDIGPGDRRHAVAGVPAAHGRPGGRPAAEHDEQDERARQDRSPVA